MKILMVSQYYPPWIGGKEYWVYWISKKLDEMGHTVTVVTSDVTKNSKKESDEKGVNVVRLRTLFDLKSMYTPVSIPSISATDNVDVIHLHGPSAWLTTVYAILAKIKNIPIVISYYNDPMGWENLNFLKKIAIGIYANTIQKIKLQLADRITSLNEYYAGTSKYLKGKDYSILPMGVPTEIFQPGNEKQELRRKLGIKKEEKVILFVGRLDWRKGVSRLIRAAAKVKNAKLVIVGDGPEMKNLKKISGDDVIFTGFVKNEDTVEFYRMCDVFVLPSIHRMESFGAVLIEAMACGKPVIVSSLTGPADIVKKSGAGIITRNEIELENALKNLLNKKNLREQMGKKGVNFVKENYDYRMIARKVEDIYKEVLS